MSGSQRQLQSPLFSLSTRSLLGLAHSSRGLEPMTVMTRSLAGDRQAGHHRNCHSSWELTYLQAPGKERASHERRGSLSLKPVWGGLVSVPDLNLQCYLKESVSNHSDILIWVYVPVPEKCTNQTPNSRIFFTISVNIKWTILQSIRLPV